MTQIYVLNSLKLENFIAFFEDSWTESWISDEPENGKKVVVDK